MASSSQRTNEDNQDFADRTIAVFEKVFPGGAVVNAIFAVFILVMPGASYYMQSKFAAVGSLLFIINVILCSACGLAATSSKQQLKATIRAGGMGKLFISATSLAVQLLFLTGLLFFFLVMNMVQLAQGLVGMGFTIAAMVAAIFVWLVQLKDSNKGISLPEQE